MTKTLPGIHGVLGSYLTPPAETHVSRPAGSAGERVITDQQPREPRNIQRMAARRGRPLRKLGATAGPKEKTTLRLSAALMSDYRDWSWDQRCQLGELVERALADYRSRHRRESPEV